MFYSVRVRCVVVQMVVLPLPPEDAWCQQKPNRFSIVVENVLVLSHTMVNILGCMLDFSVSFRYSDIILLHLQQKYEEEEEIE